MTMLFTYLYNAFKKIVYNIIISGCNQRENILAFKKLLICSIKNNSSDNFDDSSDKQKSSDELFELIELESVKQYVPCPIHLIKTNFKHNTSPNLTINKESLQLKTRSVEHLNTISNNKITYKPDFYCRVCNKKMLEHATIYCYSDNIFCTPNCRDRFLNYF